jgi:hypothetical protein
MTPIVPYVSGPYTATTKAERQANIDAALRVGAQLWEAGYPAITPHGNTANFEELCACAYDDYITGDLEILSRCDAVVMAPGWETSKGAKIEREYALNHGIAIFNSVEEFLKSFAKVK